MTDIHYNLNNFLQADLFSRIFPVSNEFEFTAKGVFRRKDCRQCSHGHAMAHNGYDYARKHGLGKVRIGKQRCMICGEEYHEDKGFWKNLLSRWNEAITKMILVLRPRFLNSFFDCSAKWAVLCES